MIQASSFKDVFQVFVITVGFPKRILDFHSSINATNTSGLQKDPKLCALELTSLNEHHCICEFCVWCHQARKEGFSNLISCFTFQEPCRKEFRIITNHVVICFSLDLYYVCTDCSAEDIIVH